LIVELRVRPLDTLLDWLRALGPHTADVVVSRLGTIVPPALLGDASVVRAADAFQRRANACGMSVAEEVGTVLTVAALIDFVLRDAMCGTGYPKGSGLDAACDPDDAACDPHDGTSDADQWRRRQWLRACASWDALRRTTLSIEAVADYLDERRES